MAENYDERYARLRPDGLRSVRQEVLQIAREAEKVKNRQKTC